MKRLNNIFCALLALLSLAVVSCSESDVHEAGPADVAGCYDVYFPVQDNTGAISLDPVEATKFTYKVLRTNTEGAITVPVKVSANTDQLYTYSAISFGEGEDTTTFTVELSPDSALGVEYKLELAIVDPQYVPQYSNDATKNTSLSLAITRVKWLDLGLCNYTDDLITSWWGISFSGEWAGVTHPTYPVMVQVREDSIDQAAFEAALNGTGSDAGLVGIYRMLNPYLVGPWTGLDYGAPELEGYANHIIFYVDAVNKVWVPLQETGMPVNGGMSSIYSRVAYYKDNNREDLILDSYYGIIQNGCVLFPQDSEGTSGLWGCPGGTYVGSNTYGANYDEAFCLNLAPALNRYTLELPTQTSEGDFVFEAVELDEDMLFYSESQVSSWKTVLEVGMPAVTTDDADRDFVAQYGNVYRLPNLYAEGYDILFAAKGSKVITLPGLELQAMGVNIGGDNLLFAIDADESEFNPETNEVALVATLVSGYSPEIIYGDYVEALLLVAPEFPVSAPADLRSDFEYRTLFTDALISSAMQNSWDADFQKGLCLDPEKGEPFKEVYGDAYCIPNMYAEGYNIYFAAKDGEVKIPAGYELQPMGISILGEQAFFNITLGSVTETGVTLKGMVVNGDGEQLVKTVVTEKLVTYKWNDLTTGTWSNAFTDTYSGRKLQQAEGTNIYRVLDFWGVAGKNFVFTWDETTNKCDVDGVQMTGDDMGDGEVGLYDVMDWYQLLGYNYTWEFLEQNALPQPAYDPATLTFSFILKYALPDLGPGIGYQNFYRDTFVLDSAPQKAEWADYAVGTFTHTQITWWELPSLPFAEENLTMQRLGDTNQYRFPVAGGTFNMLLDWDGKSAPKVLGVDTTIRYKEDDGSLTTVYIGDVWACFQAWGSAQTEDKIYAAFPNGYDAETKTFSLNLVYYDLLGFNYGDPAVYYFQITGEPTATASAPRTLDLKVATPKRAMKANAGERKFHHKMVDTKVVAEQTAPAQKVEVRNNGGVANAKPYKKESNELGKRIFKQNL